VEQRLVRLDGRDRVGALAVGEDPGRIGRRQIAEAAEAERAAPSGCGAEPAGERPGMPGHVVRGHLVVVEGIRREPLQGGVIGEDRQPVDAVGVGALHCVHRLGASGGEPVGHSRVRGLRAGRPRHDHRRRRVITPREVDLLRRPIGHGRAGAATASPVSGGASTDPAVASRPALPAPTRNLRRDIASSVARCGACGFGVWATGATLPAESERDMATHRMAVSPPLNSGRMR